MKLVKITSSKINPISNFTGITIHIISAICAWATIGSYCCKITILTIPVCIIFNISSIYTWGLRGSGGSSTCGTCSSSGCGWSGCCGSSCCCSFGTNTRSKISSISIYSYSSFSCYYFCEMNTVHTHVPTIEITVNSKI